MHSAASGHGLLAPPLQPELPQEDGMTRFEAIGSIFIVAAACTVFAQTPPLPANGAVSVRGCVAPVQRDGSLAPKAGTTATPETAPIEANRSDELTGVFMLLDASPSNAPTTSTAPRASYSLAGHEPELTKQNGYRVEIVGSVVPKAERPEKGQPGSDAIQRIRVTSVKRIAGSCSAAKK
jgi:hypothetical protein